MAKLHVSLKTRPPYRAKPSSNEVLLPHECFSRARKNTAVGLAALFPCSGCRKGVKSLSILQGLWGKGCRLRKGVSPHPLSALAGDVEDDLGLGVPVGWRRGSLSADGLRPTSAGR